MDFLQLIGIGAIASLSVVCVLLSLENWRGSFLTVGQTVFKWLAFALIFFLITRCLGLFDVLVGDGARIVNSSAFLVTVIGILASVVRHARTWRTR